MVVKDSTRRFSSRVENYVRYRPAYPSAVLDLLKQECGLTTASVTADIASGTGIFTRILLENGNRVYGVEPNADMRAAGGGISAAGKTTHQRGRERPKPRRLPTTASTWSPPPRRPTGLIAKRRAVSSLALAGRVGGPCCCGTNGALAERFFFRAYERLLGRARHRLPGRALPSAPRSTSKPSLRPRDFRSALLTISRSSTIGTRRDGLLSSSYTPQAGDAGHTPMVRRIAADIRCASGRRSEVTFEYDTLVYYGQLG